MTHGTVLLVDDSMAVRTQLSEVLTRDGHHVLQAADGDEALGILHRVSTLHLVICDLHMPKLDGLKLLSWCKASAHKDVPFLMLTHDGNPHRIKQARDMGAVGWVTKPFNPSTVLHTARRLVHLQHEPTLRDMKARVRTLG